MPKSKSSKPGGARIEKQLEPSLRKAIAALEQNGYRYALIGGIAVSQWGFPRATNDVDLKVLVPDSDYAGVRAVRRELDSFFAWICSPEDLIIQKVTAGRGKDWLDVEAMLLAQRGKLDEAYIDDWLAQFAEALENPEMLENYRQLAEKAKAL